MNNFDNNQNINLPGTVIDLLQSQSSNPLSSQLDNIWGRSGLVPVFPQQVVNLTTEQNIGDTLIVSGKTDELTTLSFSWTERNAVFNNEIGVFVVDELGRVDGVAPGETGYARAAINSATRRIIFSSSQKTGAHQEFTFAAGERLAFYLIQNNSTENWLLSNPDNQIGKGSLALFSINGVNPEQFDHVSAQTLNNGSVQFNWEDWTGGGDRDFNDVVFSVGAPRKALSVPGETGQKIKTKFTWTGREADFNNELGLFIVDDVKGRIGNLLPKDPGYARAALSRASRQLIFTNGQTQGAITNLELNAQAFFGLYLIQNATTEQFLSQNPENIIGDGPSAFFFFPGANPDGYDHIRELAKGEFAWEDSTSGGDGDYNDLVFRYEFDLPIGEDKNVENKDGIKNNTPEIISQAQTELIVQRNSNVQIKGIALETTQVSLGEIQGQAFLDFDQNGQLSREAGLDGLAVELVNAITGEVLAIQITRSFDVNGDGKIDPFAEQGLYRFTNLQAGTYQVRQSPNTAYSITTAAAYNLTLNGGQRTGGINFGNAQNYVYDVRGIDADEDTLTYSLISAPQGARIDSLTGKLIWTPSAIGEYAFKVKVADGRGGEDIQEFTLNVLDPNRLPSISSKPSGNATVGQNYTYQIVADNPDFDGLNFQLNQAPQGMNISPDGLIQWTPQANQVGAQQVKLLVKDGRDGEVEQIFTILTKPANQTQPSSLDNFRPIITSDPITTPRQQYTYDVDAIDPDGDVLKYSLLTALQGMTIDVNTGLISWNPGTQAPGDYNISVRVEDGKGGFDNQSFTLALSDTIPGEISGIVWEDLNANGLRDTSFVQGANPDVVFILDVSWSADDPFVGSSVGDLNGDRLANTILDAEIAAFIALNQQLIRQGLGQTARVSVIDFAGGAFSRDMIPGVRGTQLVTNPTGDSDNNNIVDVEQVLRSLRTRPSTNFESALQEAERVLRTIGTTPGNGTIVFLSDGVNTIGGSVTDEVNKLKDLGVKLYAFGVGEGAALNDADRLDDDLITIDSNAKIFRTTDELLGTFNDLGNGENIVEPGLAGVRVYLDTNNNAVFNADEPSQITTATGQYQFTGLLPSTYTVRQVVPNRYAQTFPTSTTSNLGFYTVNLGAGEIVENRNFGNQNATPKPNQLPNFISLPQTDARSGKLFRYEVTATDPDGDILTYKLVTKPTGMAIDSERGVLIWQPAADQLGNFNVVLQVEDGKGGSATQSFQINVVDGVDRELPVVDLGFTSNVVNIGESVTFQVAGTDNNGIANIALTIDGNPVTLNAGSATVQLNKPGVFQVAATATDTAGNIVKKDLSLRVLDPSDTTAPAVEIISPQTNKTITNLTDIVGSVSDDNLEFYRVDYAPLDLVDINNLAAADPDFVTISEGKTNVNRAIIGQFDPTVLFNGNYVLRVTAQDFSGNISSRGVFLGVSGDNKIGNFRLELTDLSIPLAGIPIQINRVYDTLQSSFSGDFGFGWNLGVKDAKIQESVPLTEAEKQGVPSFFGANPFTAGTKVYLTNPEGRRVGFTFDPFVAGASLLGAFWKPRFIADPGVYDKLEVDDINLQQRSDGTFGLFLFGFAYNPSEYKLTTKDGTTYEYDQFTGLQEIKDRNNNTLTFRDNGIFSSTGATVEFLRDTQGRITQIKDPTGKAILYGYDAKGNLVSVTDRNNNTTQFIYNNPNRRSFLTEIIDPLGRKGVRTEYDDKGRLARIIDGNGNVTNLGFDANGSVQTITDALGNPTTLVYDNRGNLIQEIDANGGIIQRSYDANNNLLSVKNPLGNTSTYTYDKIGNLLSETDALGNKTIYTYDDNNQILTITDALGNLSTNTYDSRGNLIGRQDAAGNTATYTYDGQGKLLTLTDADGNITRYTHDSLGRVTTLVDGNGETTRFVYDGNGNISSIVSARGFDTRFTYDGEGRLTKVTDALGNVSQVEYNAAGDRTAVIDALGRRTEYHYNNKGLQTEIIYADGTKESFIYDANGNRIASIDRAGRQTNFTYDALGRLINRDEPCGCGAAVKFEYDAAGRVTASIDERGNRTEFKYDAAGRRTIVRDALGFETKYTYDAVGNVIQIADALNRQTQFTYDSLGQLTKTTFADGTKVQNLYDELGRVIKEIDQNGIATEFEYDALDNLTAVIDAAGNRTSYEYDSYGNLLSKTDALGRTTRYEYDALNQRTTTILPLGQRENYTYDAVGNITSIADFNGQIIRYTYGLNNELLQEQFANGSNVTYTYTPTLQRATVTDNRGITRYTYDLRDRLTSRTDPDGSQVTYTYDKASNRTSVTTASGKVSYTYDALNRIDTVTDRNGGIIDYTYNAVGNLISTSLPNGITETRTYNAVNSLVSLEQRSKTGAAIAAYSYSYDPTGRRNRIEEINGEITEYNFDSLYRLSRENITTLGNGNRSIIYTYDAVGNRLTRNDSANGISTYIYDANNRLQSLSSNGVATTYSYDINGNTLSESNAGGTTTYNWGQQNRLLGVTTANGDIIQYQYDADGNRVAEIVNGLETRFRLDDGQQFSEIIEEYAPDGTAKVTYTFGNDLISQANSGNITYQHGDAQGTVKAITNNLGNLTGEIAYDAFGRVLSQTGTTSITHQYTGEQFDVETELTYLRARYYDAEVGRFLSRDAFEGFPNRPLTQNQYSYTENDPVNGTDPSGNATALDYGQILRGIALPIAKTATRARLRTVLANPDGTIVRPIFDIRGLPVAIRISCTFLKAASGISLGGTGLLSPAVGDSICGFESTPSPCDPLKIGAKKVGNEFQKPGGLSQAETEFNNLPGTERFTSENPIGVRLTNGGLLRVKFFDGGGSATLRDFSSVGESRVTIECNNIPGRGTLKIRYL